MDSDTTDPSYWLNWRFFLCATWVLSAMAIASILIWKFEGSLQDDKEREEEEEGRDRGMGDSYMDESWMPCLETIHPAWLLVFRIIAFLVCLILVAVNILVEGASQMYYYTQWTFLLVTIYFGLGSLLSAFGCHKYAEMTSNRIDCLLISPEDSTYTALANFEASNGSLSVKNRHLNIRKIVYLGSHLFQIIYQTNAGAVMLTDIVFWLIIFPFLTLKDYDISFLQIAMHSLNAVFLIGDTALNCMEFPCFRIAYFMLWTSIYVIFQWFIHSFISVWWPYPFLDLSSAYSPIWYLAIAVLHVPCYVVFPLMIKLKQCLLISWFPYSYYTASHKWNSTAKGSYGN